MPTRPRLGHARRSSLTSLAILVAGSALLVAACSSPAPVRASPDPSAKATGSQLPSSPPPTATGSATAVLPAANLALPFDPPTSLPTLGRLVFAHYFPPFTQSIDNKPPASDYYTQQFLDPGGENGKHKAYGGFLRDRPVPRPPRPQKAWQLVDQIGEVTQASRAGIDGFVLDLVEVPGDPDLRVLDVQRTLLDAAQTADPRFRIMLMPDMSGGMRFKSVDVVAAYVAKLGALPSAFHLSDGRLVVAPFNAENHSVDWWKQFMSLMHSAYGTEVALVPLFQDERVWTRKFAPISYGISTWGSRNPEKNTTDTGADTPIARAEAVHRLGKVWMQTVSVQDERPSQGIYDEAENTQNLRNTWQIARDSQTEWVQIATWNDFAEGTAVEPSVRHGWTYLDLMSYYATWFKTGEAPSIVRDTVYVTHRQQPAAALPSYPETSLMTIRPGSQARDQIEALALLTAPGAMAISVGGVTTTCQAGAGVTACTAPLRPGTVSVTVSRGGAPVLTVVSPFPVTATPYVQDLQYVAASSARRTAR